MKKIIFVDRDGTILVEPPKTQQINGLNDMVFLPNVISSLKRITENGWEVVMVTNQDGLGTASNPRENYDLVNQKLFEILNSEGIEFLAVFEDGSFAKNPSLGRKPSIGMVDNFLRENQIDFTRSFMVGDRKSDMQFAQNIGVRGFLLEDWDWIFLTEEVINQPRKAVINRKTKETEIVIDLNLDGSGQTKIDTGLKFFDHMLDQLGKHGNFDLMVQCQGDLEIDEHHTIEDTALVLGETFRKALDDKRGIERYASEKIIIMDEAKVEVAIDISGRPFLQFDEKFSREYVGDFPTEMFQHFLRSFCEQAGITLYMKFSGENTHHLIEVAFKGLARTLREVVKKTSFSISSTKGIL